MKLHINEDAAATETEITVRCKALDAETLRLIALLRVFDAKLTGVKISGAGSASAAAAPTERSEELCILATSDVLYIDTADKRTFLYTQSAVYESPLRLYELAERLAPQGFVRVGKSVVLNFSCVKSLRPDFGGRMRVTLSNGETVCVSRQYVPDIKALLGV